MMRNGKKKIVAFGAILSLSAFGLLACGSGDKAEGGTKTLNITMANHPWTDAIKPRIAEFEKEHDVKVETSIMTADQTSASYNVKLNAGATDLDVLMYRPLQEGVQFSRNGWLLPLNEKATSAEGYNWDDFMPSTIDTVTYEDKAYGVPIVTERQLLFYRTDLLEEAGLEVPKTMEELEAAAKALTNPEKGIFGYGMRGQRTGAVTQYAGFLFSHGGDFMVDGKAAINTPEAVASYELYGRLLRDYGPIGVESMSTEQLVPLFQQGKLAMYIDAEVFHSNFVDPEASTVVDHVGSAPLPAGPAGSKPYNVPSWGLAINAKSKQTDLAWEFVQWATSPEMVADVQKAGTLGARDSVWADSSILSDLPADFAEAIRVGTETGVGHDRPQVVQVARARDIVGGPIIAAIQGKDVQKAADDAQKEFEQFLIDDASATSAE